MAAEGQSDRMASDLEACTKQRGGTEFLHEEKMALINTEQCLLNIDWGMKQRTGAQWGVSGAFQQWWQWNTFADADLHQSVL